MGIEKVIDSDFEGIILDPDNYEGEINHIEIPHERTRHRNEAITEEEHAILRSELGKLMWVARIPRPGAIYDASTAAQTFSMGKMVDISDEIEVFSENGEKEDHPKASKNDFEPIPGFSYFYRSNKRMLTKWIF